LTHYPFCIIMTTTVGVFDKTKIVTIWNVTTFKTFFMTFI
jgi:hypothetical protein